MWNTTDKFPPFHTKLITARVEDDVVIFDEFEIWNEGLKILCADWYTGDEGHLDWRYWIVSDKDLETLPHHERVKLFCSFQAIYDKPIKRVIFDVGYVEVKDLL